VITALRPLCFRCYGRHSPNETEQWFLSWLSTAKYLLKKLRKFLLNFPICLYSAALHELEVVSPVRGLPQDTFGWHCPICPYSSWFMCMSDLLCQRQALLWQGLQFLHFYILHCIHICALHRIDTCCLSDCVFRGSMCRTWWLALPQFTVRCHSVTYLTFLPKLPSLDADPIQEGGFPQQMLWLRSFCTFESGFFPNTH